jgi:hypothetical protein
MANRRFIDFPIASTVGDNDIVLIWQDGLNKQTTKGTLIQGAPTTLEGLTDVDIAGLINGQILQYNSVTAKWENVDRAGLNLSELGDVSIVSPSNGQVLVYNSTTSKWENSSGGYVPYTGAVTTVDLGAQGLRAGYIRFDTSVVSVSDEQGLMYWDDSRSTAALIMNGTLQHIGQDTFFYVKNSTGSSIAKGTAVRFDGTDGASGHLLIAPFLANGTYPSTYFMGVTAETISSGSFGQVMHFGELSGINTSGYTAGALLYASTTVAGGFQTTAPVAPNNIVLIAAAINSKNNGNILVRPTYGSNINQDEGVKIVSGATGDLLQLQAGGLWENKTIDGAGIVTKATNQTITGIKTFTQDIDVNGLNIGRGGGNAIENTRLGNSALGVNTTGSGNTAIGSFALSKNTTGGGNTAVGTQTLQENTTGEGNTAVGQFSLIDNTTGVRNSALGYLSLSDNTTGIDNVGIGFFSLFTNTTGSDNTALGHNSGSYIADGSTTNSITNNSIYIGSDTKAQANNQTNQIVIGHNAIGNGSNTVTIGNSSITNNYFTGNIRGGAFIKSGGSSAQFLKADGSVDSTSYGTGSVTSVAALTLGTSGTDLSSTVANGTTTPVITLNVPTASATNRGALSSADWTTFNNKQNALTNPVTGTGTTNYLPKFTGSTTIGNSIVFDNGTNVGIGTNVPYSKLDVAGSLSINGRPILDNSSAELYIGGITGVSGRGTDVVALYTNNTERIKVFSDGNTFIGSSSSNAGFKLDVNGTGRFSGSASTPVTLTLTSANSNCDITMQSANSSSVSRIRNGTNDLQFHTNGTLALTLASNQAATFSSSNARLSLNSTTTTNSSYMSFGNSVTGYVGLDNSAGTDFGNGAYSMNIFNGGAYNLNLGTSNVTRLTITSSGNVLIGTTTSGSSKLRIVGLPTSSSGLSSGDVWNDGGTLKIA